MDESQEKGVSVRGVVQFSITLLLTIAIFWLVYKDENWTELKEVISQAKMFWLLLPIAIGLFSHYLRALRWKMLIVATGYEAKTRNIFFAVMVGYLANFLFPRAGEVARCGMLKQYDGVSFPTLIGTVLTERLFDLIMTVLIIAVTIALQYGYFADILSQVDLYAKFMGVMPYLVILLVAFGVAFLYLYSRRKESKLYAKGKEGLHKIGQGFASFKNVRNKPLFIFYSVLIFVCYYLMLYVSFWAFIFTEDLSLVSGLVVYVMGALGIIAPVQGGIGAWHFLTITALGFYGVPPTEAKAFALATHTVQTIVVYVGFGLLSYILLNVLNRSAKKS